MEIPEYLAMFSNEGNYKISVKFKDIDGCVADQTMSEKEVLKLIDPLTEQFYKQLRFDDWLFDVYKYEIDPVKMKIKIYAKKTTS